MTYFHRSSTQFLKNYKLCGYNDYVGIGKYYDKLNSLVSSENDITLL